MAATVNLTKTLRTEYQKLFDDCEITVARKPAVDQAMQKLLAARPRYTAVGGPLNIPWFFIGVVHAMESGTRFDRHLHNGDPLAGRTVQYPLGRPKDSEPPFTWEQSATDALQFEGLDHWGDWSLAGTLYRLEKYNGFGYRMKHPEVLTPYLWSFSNLYSKGKYIQDGSFSATAVSQQCGGAVLLRDMLDQNLIEFAAGDAT